MAVLWSVVLLALIAGMVLSLQRTGGRVARRFVDAAFAEVAADSALNLTLLQLGALDMHGAAPTGRTALRMPSFAQNISVSIQRERERVDLNAARADTLVACFVAAGFPQVTARSMASRVIDWRDPDDIPGPGGAETADYHAAGLHYGPRNGPFRSIEELRQVLGMDTLRTSVLSQFTVYTHQSGDDMSSLGVDGNIAAPATHCGGSQWGSTQTGGTSGPNGLIGEVIRLRACSSERVRLCRLVVARLTGSKHRPLQIFLWQTETMPNN